ncbi:TPR repeat-containing protein DDB_G0287407-like [Apostichopus japonicus]|uniref:TPR repeat-containing protein DDB_G0287407-like n=1 Tax=Stichopus japonicus TaxID=307972 RepID=UPI003AB4175D
MGCGASRSCQYEVMQQWDSAEKTIEVHKLKQKPVIKRSGWKTVRVFVSSTFRDFHAERELLVKEVFPDLRAWCAKRRLHLVDCDLRWGVPKDTTTENTLRTCLGELDRCYADNIMPFFLNMTSERCGWIPGLSEVPRGLVKDYRWIFGLSVTEMEIMHGAYRKDNPNSLFAIRDESFLETLPESYKKDFVDINPIASEKTKMLKEMLHSRFPDERVFKYSCKFAGIDADTGKVDLDGLQDQFSKEVYRFFQERIEDQYPLDTSIKLDPYEVQRESHESFMKSRSAVVLGRSDILQKIEDYIVTPGSSNQSLLLLGGPGTGKSSIMARTADQCVMHAHSGEIEGGGSEGWHIFYHFVGAIPGSTDPEEMLRRLLRELKICNDSNMPKNLEAAAQLVSSVLSNPNTRPTIMIIDALNQLDDDKSSALLSWLPRRLSPSVRCIFSMIDDTPPHRSLRNRTLKPTEVTVTPLDMKSRQAIVTEMLGQYNKRLDAEQMSSLLSKNSSQNPLWLAIACEELRVYGEFSKVTDKINSLQDGLLNLLAQVFDRFEEENGGNLLTATLCLLEASQTGLLEVELLSILGDEDNLMPSSESEAGKEKASKEQFEKEKVNQPLAAIKWAAIYRGLRPFLRPFGDSGEGRLDFYHRSLSKAVRRKYFNHESDDPNLEASGSLWWHKKLADYFENVTNIERKVEEYPTQLCKIKDKKRLSDCLSDWAIFDQMYNPYYSTQLLALWRNVGEKYEEMEECYRKKIEEIRESSADTEVLAERLTHVAKLYIQGGLFKSAQKLLDEVILLEEAELGNRPERMVELLDTYGELCDEICKIHDFITREQIKDLRPAIKYSRDSADIRRTLEGPVHKYKLGLTVMRLSFNLNTWMECNGDNTLSATEAAEQSKEYIEQAINIFKDCGDLGKEAEATMTKAVIFPRGSPEQIELYEKAREQCQQAYGEHCKLMTRILSNTGIYYEDRKDYYTAYDFFVKWKDLSMEVFGENHPRTVSATNCLSEPTYRRIAQAIREGQNQGGDNIMDSLLEDDYSSDED